MSEIISFIGGGNMASAMISGLRQKNIPATIRVVDPNPRARERLASSYQVEAYENHHSAINGASVIILAVKPQTMSEVLTTIAPGTDGGQLVISVAAGIPCSKILRQLGSEQALIRAMPNTPATIGLGITGLFATPACSALQRSLAVEILSATGKTVWIEDESQMDMVTAVSGSGPAYFYYLIEALTEAATAAGLKPDTAQQLAIQTALGSATLAASSGVAAAELRRRVTSPGGTTEAALAVLQQEDFKGLMERAIVRAAAKGRQLSEEMN